MLEQSWRKALASFEESPIWAEHFVRILFKTRDSLSTGDERDNLDALVAALFPYTFFGAACRHLFGHYLWGTLDPGDDPVSAAFYYPPWTRGINQYQSQIERDAYRIWKQSRRCLDLPYLKKRQIELNEKPKVMGSVVCRKPKYLAAKLLAIRQAYGGTESWVASLLRLQPSARISDYECGRRIPSLPRLLHYSRIAGVPLEHIVDDELDLVTFKRELMLTKSVRENSVGGSDAVRTGST